MREGGIMPGAYEPPEGIMLFGTSGGSYTPDNKEGERSVDLRVIYNDLGLLIHQVFADIDTRRLSRVSGVLFGKRNQKWQFSCQ